MIICTLRLFANNYLFHSYFRLRGVSAQWSSHRNNQSFTRAHECQNNSDLRQNQRHGYQSRYGSSFPKTESDGEVCGEFWIRTDNS